MTQALAQREPRDDDRATPVRKPVWSQSGRQIFAFDRRDLRAVADHAIAETRQAFPGRFESRTEVQHMLDRICLPASERWAYMVLPKAATTTTLALLFEAEFGVPFTARATMPTDPNPDTGLHSLMQHNIFTTALKLPRSLPDLAADPRLERIAVVRHPELRAASAFEYVCLSNDEAKWFFFPDRAKMSALFGLNFETMARSSDGFVRFLEYVAADLATNPVFAVNFHWRPQARLLLPDLFRPTLVGKVEAYGAFRRALFERLGRPDPGETPRRNGYASGDRGRLFADPAAQRLVRAIYATDYEAFGYEPGEYADAPPRLDG